MGDPTVFLNISVCCFEFVCHGELQQVAAGACEFKFVSGFVSAPIAGRNFLRQKPKWQAKSSNRDENRDESPLNWIKPLYWE